MMSEWRYERFARMADLVRDPVLPSEASRSPYIGLEHIGEGTLQLIGVGVAEDATSTKTRFTAGDILFGKLRPYFRKVVRAPFDGICSTDIWVVRPTRGVDAGFLFYLMASDVFVEPVVRASEGTKMPRAKWEYAASLDVPLPPLPEQRAIAHILGTLDDKIELNRRMSETLEQMARAIFKAWFVDFEPVRAKMDGRWQRGRSLPGLPAHLYDLFPDRLVPSELGPIPEGWEVVDLPKAIDFLEGPGLRNWQYKNEGMKFLNIRCINKGDLDLSKANCIGLEEFEKNYKHFALQEDDIVISTSGTLGRLAIVRADHLPVMLNTSIIRMRGRGHIGLAYLWGFLQSEYFLNEMCALAAGSVQLNFGPMHLRQISVLRPPDVILEAFEVKSGPLLRKSMHVCKESRTLAALRDALLPKLISGELRVKDAERFLKERGL